MKDDTFENYYDVLKVDPKASLTEIVAAYHKAKNAFSKESIATYSLFDDSDIQEVSLKLEEAYQILSNPNKRHTYDKVLQEQNREANVNTLTVIEKTQKTQFPARESQPPPIEKPTPHFDSYTGTVLKQIREGKGWSIDDVSKITKVPSRFILAIEEANPKNLPARVYIQGFVKNIANLYQLNPARVVTSYLDSLDLNNVKKPAKL